MKSLNDMVRKILTLDESDVSSWELGFLESMSAVTDDGDNVSRLSEKQIAVIERIYHTHFTES